MTGSVNDQLRASFQYESTPGVDADTKAALAKFDLNKTGWVSTSELVAGAKALEEARSQTAFLRKVLAIHGVATLVLLVGMLGMSVVAIQVTKEIKVNESHQIVMPDGTPVQVESADMVVTPDGELRTRTPGSTDGRRLDDDGTLVQTAAATVEVEVDLSDQSRRLQDVDGVNVKVPRKAVDEAQVKVRNGARVVAVVKLPSNVYSMYEARVDAVAGWYANDPTGRDYMMRGNTGSGQDGWQWRVECIYADSACDLRLWSHGERMVTYDFDADGLCAKTDVC